MYEYRCDSCGNEFEKLQKMSDKPLTDCPACNKASLSKLVSAAGFQLKGSGWYVTDFKNKKPRPKDAEPTDKKNSEKKSNEAKGDKKPNGEEKKSSGLDGKDSNKASKGVSNVNDKN
tara:strand:- start:710 stop:1060 length:351 start_codon:yes stop_codon:yes gene_type:complete